MHATSSLMRIFFLSCLLILSFTSGAPMYTQAAVDAGAGIGGSVSSTKDDDKEDEPPECEYVEVPAAGVQCAIDDGVQCKNSKGYGTCVATELAAIVADGGTLTVIPPTGGKYVVDQKNFGTSPFAGTPLDPSDLNLPDSTPGLGSSWLPFPEFGPDPDFVGQVIGDPWGALWGLIGDSSNDIGVIGNDLELTGDTGTDLEFSFSGFGNSNTLTGEDIDNVIQNPISILPQLDPLGVFGAGTSIGISGGIDGGGVNLGSDLNAKLTGVNFDQVEDMIDTGYRIANSWFGLAANSSSVDETLRDTANETLGLIKSIADGTPTAGVTTSFTNYLTQVLDSTVPRRTVTLGDSEAGLVVSEGDDGVRIYDHGLTLALELSAKAEALKDAGVPFTVRGFDIYVSQQAEGFTAEEEAALSIAEGYGLDRSNPNEVAGALLLFGNDPAGFEGVLESIESAGAGENVLSRIMIDIATGQRTVETQGLARFAGGSLTDIVVERISQETGLSAEEIRAQLQGAAEEIEGRTQTVETPLYNLTAAEEAGLMGLSLQQLAQIEAIKNTGVSVELPRSLLEDVLKDSAIKDSLLGEADLMQTFEERYGPYGYLFQNNPEEKGLVDIVREWGEDRLNQVIGNVAPSGDLRVNPMTGDMDPGATAEYGYARGRLHAGVDLYAPDESNLTGVDIPVVAVVDGRVVRAQVQNGYGYTIDIMGEDGVVYRYAHISPADANGNAIQVGDTVQQGQEIAYVTGGGTDFGRFAEAEFGGDTEAAEEYLNENGWPAGMAKPHLHFEVRTASDFNGSSSSNPLSLFPDLRPGNTFTAGQIADAETSGVGEASLALHNFLTGVREEIYGTVNTPGGNNGNGGPGQQPGGNGTPGTATPGGGNNTPGSSGGSSGSGNGSVGTGGTGGTGGIGGIGNFINGKGGAPVVSQPSMTCNPNAVVGGTSERITISWQCPSSSTAAGVGFSTGGSSSGQVRVLVPSTAASFISYGVDCAGGVALQCTIDILQP